MTTQTMTDHIAIAQERDGYAYVDRDDAIKAIRAALKRRTGKTWSVKGGRGTAWGWITIDAPPKRKTGVFAATGELVDSGEPQQYGYMTPQDAAELAAVLGLERVHHQGVDIPAGNDYRVEYIARAEGRNPSAIGVPYWD